MGGVTDIHTAETEQAKKTASSVTMLRAELIRKFTTTSWGQPKFELQIFEHKHSPEDGYSLMFSLPHNLTGPKPEVFSEAVKKAMRDTIILTPDAHDARALYVADNAVQPVIKGCFIEREQFEEFARRINASPQRDTEIDKFVASIRDALAINLKRQVT